MGAKDDQNSTDSPPKVEVGEIDTRAPFQSVKDAVTLFGEGALSGGKPTIRKRIPSSENVLVKETQLHLSKKELNKLKDQLKNAETTKAQALIELEIAIRIVEDLTQKLRTVTKSKDSAIKSTETAKNQAKQIEGTKSGDTPRHDGARKHDLESTREQYMTIFIKLASLKIKLWKVRHKCDACLEAKLVALNQAVEAEQAAEVNVEKVSELSKEISTVQESIEQVKLASLQAHHEQAQIFVEKDVLKHFCEVTLEASTNKLLVLKNEFDPKLACNLEKELTETMNEIHIVQKQMENIKALDLEYVRTVTLELDSAKESLQKVKEEESSLRSLLESLKLKLENVKKEHSELKEKEAETESIIENMHVKLHKSRAKLKVALAEESNVRGASEEMILTLHQLSLEAENAQQEAEEMKYKAEESKKEAESTRITLEEAEKKLRVVAEEAEEAKRTEKSVLDQIKVFAERINVARTLTSESGANITISREEFKALSRKVEESNTLTEMKVAAAIAQVEVIKASENEVVKRFETTYKEIEDMKLATQEALKRAEMDEAAKKAIEGELLRWHGQEQRKSVENLSPILVEIEKSLESSPRHYRKQNPNPHKVEVQKLEEKKKSVFKKAHLPNINSIFHRKKKQIEGGSSSSSSSSYLPGEKHA